MRGVGLEFGGSMLSSGALGAGRWLWRSRCAIRAWSADTVLLLAAVGVLLGEWLGPGALRRALARAGEIKPEVPPESAQPTLPSEA